MQSQDIWSFLERHWSNFFWLTGETPDSWSNLVQDLSQEFVHYFHVGKRAKLDLRNQVSTKQLLGFLTFYIYFWFSCPFAYLYEYRCCWPWFGYVATLQCSIFLFISAFLWAMFTVQYTELSRYYTATLSQNISNGIPCHTGGDYQGPMQIGLEWLEFLTVHHSESASQQVY